VRLGESSWNVDVVFSPSEEWEGDAILTCRPLQSTLHVASGGLDLRAVVGRNGSIFSGSLVSKTSSPVSYGVTVFGLELPTESECELSDGSALWHAILSEVTLQALDENHDGVADRIEASGVATGDFLLADLAYTIPLNFELHGVPDTQPPSFLAQPAVHPLDTFTLTASEPISTSTTARLDSATTRVQLAGLAQLGAYTAFTSQMVLPWGTAFSVQVSGADLAGVPFGSGLPIVKTLADPGLFAQDGFEGPLNAWLTGEAKLVANVGTFPALAGGQSLFVPVGSSATLHLARPPGASRVRLSAQTFVPLTPIYVPDPPIEAGVIGGSVHVAAMADQVIPRTPTEDARWSYTAPPQELTLPISESGGDIVLRIAVPDCSDDLCLITEALLVDDLRVE